MLDIHPPEHAAHTWRDFLIHIATIVVGLLIAIGLEQTVEYLHHRHQIEIARERIHEEIHVNERIIDDNNVHLGEIMDRLNHNLIVLRALEAHQPPPGAPLDFSWQLQGSYNAAYESAHNSGTISLLPYDEGAMYSDCYQFSAIDLQEMFKLIADLNTAHASMRGHTVQQLSPGEIQTLLSDNSTALEEASYIRTMAQLERHEWEAALNGHYRNDFAGSAH